MFSVHRFCSATCFVSQFFCVETKVVWVGTRLSYEDMTTPCIQPCLEAVDFLRTV